MATTAGTVVTDVLRQVRDVGANGHSRVFTLEVVSHAQRTINAIVKAVLRTQTLTLVPRQLFYSISLTFTDYIQAVAVRYHNQNLHRTSLRGLRNSNPDWPRKISSVPSFFTPVGINLLVIFPVPEVVDTVDVTYVQDTGVIAGENIAMALPDHAMQSVKDLAAATLFLRQRDFAQVQVLIKSLQQRLGRFRDE